MTQMQLITHNSPEKPLGPAHNSSQEIFNKKSELAQTCWAERHCFQQFQKDRKVPNCGLFIHSCKKNKRHFKALSCSSSTFFLFNDLSVSLAFSILLFHMAGQTCPQLRRQRHLFKDSLKICHHSPLSPMFHSNAHKKKKKKIKERE